MIQTALRTFIVSAFALWALGATGNPPSYLDPVIDEQRQQVAERPLDPAVHNDLGNLLLLAERVDEAESSYRRAKELEPSDSSARFNLALLLQQEGRVQEAGEELTELVEIDTDFAWAHYLLGMIHADSGKRRDALEHYARAFALDPTLTFEANNPHIIDNEHATEALLMSSRFSTSTSAKVPRSYGEGARIRQLILGDIDPENPEAAVPGEPEAGRSSAGGEPRGAGRSSGGAVFGAAEGEGEDAASYSSGTGDPGSDRGEEFGSEVDAETGRRVLRSEDLVGLPAVGQAGNVNSRRSRGRQPAAGSRASRTPNSSVGAERQDARERLRDAAGRQGSGAVRPQIDRSGTVRDSAAGGATGGGRRYIPSGRSTASLRLELLEDPAEGATAAVASAKGVGATRGL
ncbi:MAG: tetratricopeptide repeat protein [Acidobacteriota bacterium]